MKKSLYRKGFYGVLLLSLLAGVFAHAILHPESHFFWSSFPVFSALYGFLGCILIIFGSKALGHYWLQRKENYYEKK